jgi:putative flippase GtrA
MNDDSYTPDRLIERTHSSVNGWELVPIIVNCTGDGRITETIETLAQQHAGLHVVINDERQCTAVAVRNALNAAVSSVRAEAVVMCRCPVHRLELHLPVITSHLKHGVDLVLGSRIKGSFIIKHGSKKGVSGRLSCVVLSQLLRVIFFLPTRAWFRATDPQTPLLAFRVPFYKNSSEALSCFKPGTDFLQFLFYTLVSGTAQVTEIPIQGECNGYTGGRLFSHVASAFRIRWRAAETKRFLKFAVVGFSGYVVNAASLEFFRQLGFTGSIAAYFGQFPHLSRFALLSSQSAWSAGFAAEIAILSNFLLNNFWTFSTHTIKSPLSFIGKLLQFNLTSFGGIVIQFFVIGLATRIFDDTALVRGVALVFAIVFLIIPYNWTIYNRLIWRVKGRKK